MNSTRVTFFPMVAVADDQLRFAVILARQDGQWLFVRHRQRATWEIPGGHREAGETAVDAARRELREETGATAFALTPICVYGVTRGDETSYGLLAFAEVTERGPLDPAMEIGEVALRPLPPDALTYPEIQPALFLRVQGWLNAR